MAWRNEESDYSSVENFAWDEKNLLSRTKSDASLSDVVGYNVCSQGVQAGFNSCKESRSFTAAFERLELEAEIDSRNDTLHAKKTRDAQTEPHEDVEELIAGFKAKETSQCPQVVRDHDILNFQGTRYSPECIARYWKKDSRMWLWKSSKFRGSQVKPESSDSKFKNEKDRRQ